MWSGREVTARPQDASLSGDQAALRARDPAGRPPEREDAISLPLLVCPCQEVTVVFRRLPGMGVHGFPPFVCSWPVHSKAITARAGLAGAGAPAAGRGRPRGSGRDFGLARAPPGALARDDLAAQEE